MQSSQQTQTHMVQSLDELHILIERHDAWGISFQEFEKRAGYRREGNNEYITHFSWGQRSSSIYEMWELVQYIHRHYGDRQ